MDTVEKHIFHLGFLESYKILTYHGENENNNVIANTTEENEGIADIDEMFDDQPLKLLVYNMTNCLTLYIQSCTLEFRLFCP